MRSEFSTMISRVGFGGGCHWCTEAVFQTILGVIHVAQGFIRSSAPDDSFSEAVIVTYDASKIDLRSLTEIHLRTHASTSAHKLRGKYRSAVYVYDDDQKSRAIQILDALREEFESPLVTRVLEFQEFKPSDERFQNYYRNGPERPFCKTYIDPKLAMLRKKFSALSESRMSP